MIAAWKRVLADGGRLVVAVGNADRTGPAGGAAPAGGVGYYQLTDALSPHFARVQMFGQTPFLGVGMIEFDAPAEGLRVDTRLLEGEGEPASHYVAVAANAEAVPLGYALVQVPFAPLEARLRAGQDERESRPPTGGAICTSAGSTRPSARRARGSRRPRGASPSCAAAWTTRSCSRSRRCASRAPRARRSRTCARGCAAPTRIAPSSTASWASCAARWPRPTRR